MIFGVLTVGDTYVFWGSCIRMFSYAYGDVYVFLTLYRGYPGLNLGSKIQWNSFLTEGHKYQTT